MGMLGCTWGCTLKVSGVFILCAVSLVMQWHTICNKFQWMCEGLLGAVCVIGCFCPWGFSESLFPELVVLAAGVGRDLLHNNLINQLLKGRGLTWVCTDYCFSFIHCKEIQLCYQICFCLYRWFCIYTSLLILGHEIWSLRQRQVYGFEKQSFAFLERNVLSWLLPSVPLMCEHCYADMQSQLKTHSVGRHALIENWPFLLSCQSVKNLITDRI